MIDNIALSIRNGYRISSHIENKCLRREAFDAMIESHNGITIDKTAVLRHLEFQLVAEPKEGDRKKMQDEILRDLMELGTTLDSFGGSNKIIARSRFWKRTISTGNWPISKISRTSTGFSNNECSSEPRVGEEPEGFFDREDRHTHPSSMPGS